jgi:hypothetical protein
MGPIFSDYDAECTAALSRIPLWVLPPEETQALHDGGQDTAPNLIYARGVPDTPDHGQTNFDKILCTLILIEIGFSRDFGCNKKHAEKTEKYSLLVAVFKEYWGRVDFVAIPIGHADTTLTRTLDHLTAAFSTVRPRVDHTNAIKDTTKPIPYSNTMSHAYRMFSSLLDTLTDLAHSRLLGIIRNMKRFVEALPGAVRRNRAHSAATPTHAHGVAITIHRTRTT